MDRFACLGVASHACLAISHLKGAEPDQLDFISMVLEDNGAEILKATNGDEVLEMARREKPDVLTLDLHMPGRDVGEVFELLRKDPELQELQVCLIHG